jgi:hypothetical protein
MSWYYLRGIHGIGGGSPRADPGRHRAAAADVTPATLASTLVTSAAGVITFAILAIHQRLRMAPD